MARIDSALEARYRSGAAVAGAEITVTDLATGPIRRLTTDADGLYEASGLRTGDYTVSATATGFNTREVKGISLRSGGVVRIDISLQVRTATETVVVTSEAPLVATESPTISSTLNNQQLLTLPRDSRDIYSFLYTNPNITQSGADGGFKFIGAQSYGASFSLDGQRSNGGVFGQPTSSQPSLETIGELTVMSNNFTAEYAGIANVRVSTKRGTNAYHGSLFYNNKNSALAAWDLRDKIGQAAFVPSPAQPSYRTPYFNLNEFGGSFGGPIPKLKRTYFFAAYEKRFFNSPVNLRNTRLPHPSLWVGDFTRMTDARKPLVPAGVTLSAAEVANDTVGGLGQRFIRFPSRLMNSSTSALIQKYFPAASVNAPINATTGALTDYFNSVPGTQRRDLGTIRVDHDFSDRDKVYGVYNAQAFIGAQNAVVAPFTGLGLTQLDRTNQTLSLSYTHIFKNGAINEARGGFNRQPTFRRSNQTMREFLTSIGFNDADMAAYASVIGEPTLDTYGHMAVNFGTGFQNFTNGGRNTFRPLDQSLMTFGDTLTWVKARHTVKMGADFVRNQARDGFTSGRGNPRGLINYTGQGPDAFARFLMGLPANNVSFVNQFRPPMDVHNWETGFFVQDDFRVSSRLTLHMGLRYEIITPFIEANDLLVNFDPYYLGAGGKRGRFVVPSNKTLASLDSRIVNYGVVTAAESGLGLGRSLVWTDKNNLAPRLGASFRLNDKTVLRGGWGIFYPTSAAQGIRDPIATNGFQQGLTKTNNPANPLQGWPGATHGFSPINGGVLNNISGFPSVNIVPFSLRQPRIQQYNATFERETGWQSAVRVSYLGTSMSGLISGSDLNLLPANNLPYGTTTGDGVTACSTDLFNCDTSTADRARLPYPQLGDYMISFGNFGRGRSNAFQIEGNRRFSGGFFFNVAYTLLDQKSTAPDTGNSSLGGTAYNQFKPNSDYGTDAFTPTHRFISYGAWQTPFGKGRKYGSDMPSWAQAVAGGWEATWQMFIKSGTGFTPFWTCDNCGPVYPGNVASGSIDATGGFYGTTFRPVVTGEGNVASGDKIFAASAFAPPPFGAELLDGPTVAKRNLLRGPGTYGLNFGVHKIFSFGERTNADLGADFNNVLNHPLKNPDNFDIGWLGSFTVNVNPTTLAPVLGDVVRNPDFGRLLTSYPQENIDSRRTVRLKLRITF